MKLPQRSASAQAVIEIVPAILRTTFEQIEHDWEIVRPDALHIQIDVTDGVFAGDGTFRDVSRFKQLAESEKCELHMMVQTPRQFADAVVDLNPARLVFHIESFAGGEDIEFLYGRLRTETTSQLGLAINPDSPTAWVEEQLPSIDYVLFMGYNPGWANQPITQGVFRKIAAFHKRYPEIPIAVDGHVDRETIQDYARSGARILCANTSIFGQGDPRENMTQLRLLAEAVIS